MVGGSGLSGDLTPLTEMTPKRYHGHEAIVALRKPWPDAHEPENIVIGCTGCGWRSSEESFSAAGFAAHLAGLDAPDYLVEYWRRWASYVEVPYGQLDRDAVARELSDYAMVMECASTVFSEIADLSKPNTAPRHVLAENERRMAERYAYDLCESAWVRILDGELRAGIAMIQVAEGWHPGAWRTFAADERHRQAWLREADRTKAPF